MPYSVGEKGSYGCSGYPTVKDDDGKVMGCHETREQAVAQIAAIEANEDKGVGIENPEEWPVTKASPCWDGYVQRGMKPGKNGKMVPNCVPVEKMFELAQMFEKVEINEGDFVVVGRKEKALVGQIIHIMREGVLGIPGADKTIEATPDSPAAMIRIFEQDDDGFWEPTDYFYGDRLSMYIKIDPLPLEPSISDMDKAEGYSPPAGARAAARRAIKFKEDGKARGAGTAVGWTRARQLANGETLSLSTVKRMYSYFSRHEVDKKGKDWGNQANPSNGYIMWLAWGGDAGYSWSRKIVQREKDKALFSNFGRDYTRSRKLSEPFL